MENPRDMQVTITFQIPFSLSRLEMIWTVIRNIFNLAGIENYNINWE